MFELPQAQVYKLKQCTAKFTALARDEPEMDLLGANRRLQVELLTTASYKKLYDVPDMSSIRFSARALIEGLIAHGILQPGQVLDLWDELKSVAIVPAFQDRILENMYTEERIRDPRKVVRGE